MRRAPDNFVHLHQWLGILCMQNATWIGWMCVERRLMIWRLLSISFFVPIASSILVQRTNRAYGRCILFHKVVTMRADLVCAFCHFYLAALSHGMLEISRLLIRLCAEYTFRRNRLCWDTRAHRVLSLARSFWQTNRKTTWNHKTSVWMHFGYTANAPFHHVPVVK